MRDARALGASGQDASMEDVGRPPGEDPMNSVSWAERVKKRSGGGYQGRRV